MGCRGYLVGNGFPRVLRHSPTTWYFFSNEITIADETSRFIDSSNEIRSSLSKDDRSIEIGDEDEDVDEEYYGRVVVLSLT